MFSDFFCFFVLCLSVTWILSFNSGLGWLFSLILMALTFAFKSVPVDDTELLLCCTFYKPYCL